MDLTILEMSRFIYVRKMKMEGLSIHEDALVS